MGITYFEGITDKLQTENMNQTNTDKSSVAETNQELEQLEKK